MLPTKVVNFEYTVGLGSESFDVATLFDQISVTPSMCGKITYAAATTTAADPAKVVSDPISGSRRNLATDVSKDDADYEGNITDEDSKGNVLDLTTVKNPLGAEIVSDFKACEQPYKEDPEVQFCFDDVKKLLVVNTDNASYVRATRSFSFDIQPVDYEQISTTY